MTEDRDYVYEIDDFDGKVLDPPGPKGLGGWLILPLFGWVGLNALQCLALMVASADETERLGALVIFGLLCVPSTLAVRRSRHFPVSWIVTFGIILGLAAIGSERGGEQLASIVVYGVWCAYMLTSKRVKNTFVR